MSAEPGYYYRSEGQEDGPVSADKLLELFETHMITAFDEVRRDGETAWQAAQTVVTAILEDKKNGGRARAASTAGGSASATQSGARPAAREQNVLVAQRGAPTPKPAGSITDAELQQSIAYARAEVKRGWMVRTAISLVGFVIAGGAAFHYSASFGGPAATPDVPWRVETQLVVDAGAVSMSTARGAFTGTGSFALVRTRDVTVASDGSATMTFVDESSRVRADVEGGPDHSELKQGVLRGQTVTFTQGPEGWEPTLAGAPNARQALKLPALAFDNSSLYPTRRMWPWPWQSWLVTAPQSCRVFGLDLEGCKGELKMRLKGFVEHAGERCARLTFEGEWEGQTEGDSMQVTLQGEILRSLNARVDLSVHGEGEFRITRTIVGPTSNGQITLLGKAVLTQVAAPAP